MSRTQNPTGLGHAISSCGDHYPTSHFPLALVFGLFSTHAYSNLNDALWDQRIVLEVNFSSLGTKLNEDRPPTKTRHDCNLFGLFPAHFTLLANGSKGSHSRLSRWFAHSSGNGSKEKSKMLSARKRNFILLTSPTEKPQARQIHFDLFEAKVN